MEQQNKNKNKKEKELATIKKPGQVEYISQEEYTERIKEIIRCKNDINYFAEKYFKIINLDKGLMTIKLYPKQKELLSFFVNERRCIVLASRQSSKTTTYTIYLLWLTMFHPEKKVMLLANKLDTCIEICGRIRLAYQYIPSFLKPAVVTWNKAEIEFSNLSVIKGFATASDAARGFSCNCVVCDETAFVPNNVASKVFESIYPVLSSSKKSQFIMVSTPNGADPNNLYYEIWSKANSKNKESNTDGWKPFRFDWWDVPGRDEQWKKNTIASIGEKRFAQEFANEFLTSDSTKKLIPDDIIEKYRIKIREYKKSNTNQGKDLAIFSQDGTKTYTIRMYHEFNLNRTYLCSSDIAEGIGKDSSVLYIWDITDLSNIKMCLRFSDNTISIMDFAYITNEICKLYANPFLACESNGLAIGYIEQLRRTYQYDNFIRLNRDNGCGIQSHITVKSRAALWFRDMMTTMGFGFELYDPNLIEEFSTFVKKDTKLHDLYAALGDNHDDHIMTMIWACWILNPENIEKYYDVTSHFTSHVGVEYPKTLQPIFEYSHEEIEYIINSVQYKDFMLYKENHIQENNNEDTVRNEISGNSSQQKMNVDLRGIENIPKHDNAYSQEEIVRMLNAQNGSSGSGDGMFFGFDGNVRNYNIRSGMNRVGGSYSMTGDNIRPKRSYDIFGFDDDDGEEW